MKKITAWLKAQPRPIQIMMAVGVPLVALAAIFAGSKRSTSSTTTTSTTGSATIADGYITTGYSGGGSYGGAAGGGGVDPGMWNLIQDQLGGLISTMQDLAESTSAQDVVLANQIATLASSTPTHTASTTFIQPAAPSAAGKPPANTQKLPLTSLIVSCSDNAINEMIRREVSVNEPLLKQYPRCGEKYAKAIFAHPTYGPAAAAYVSRAADT